MRFRDVGFRICAGLLMPEKHDAGKFVLGWASWPGTRDQLGISGTWAYCEDVQDTPGRSGLGLGETPLCRQFFPWS